jgi:hypothetical protein
MRIKAITPAGLAPSRSRRAHQRLNASSSFMEGAKTGRFAPVPQRVSAYSKNRSSYSRVSIQWVN